ncbi:diguanylate cyclase [Paenibacillus crassostreae]|uniref:Diguanylate cyclase response regulator n=1 Tax=Paenibacillus crassostreae TaxID=1763538 RepID=A0A167GBA8_9BACL|nr:diguanylate cyclase [Paenibacillus crassostreae]OAB77409.1 hypothetical protein PNBC_01680 [Paenibacillus crassostreae]
MILLDILLPDRNGLELLKLIVEKSKQEHSPIIVMSSEDTKENQLSAYRSGAMDYIAKPIDQELIIALIENRFQIKQQWEQLTIIDELTGVYNRKHFNRMMKHLIADFHRSGRVFTIVIIDIDYFKKVNDTYGHLVGDEVLRRCADTIVNNMRHEDTLCRYGGEEFALLLPNTDKNQALEVLERIHHAISSYIFSFKDQQLQVTFTAGVTNIHSDNAHSEKLFEEADQALYVGKQSGRNQTVLFSTEVISKHNEQRLNIIVVDDDRLIRKIIMSEFTKWQPNRNIVVSIKEYDNGTDFLQSDWYSEQEKYIILLDGIMPETDGVEVLKRIRYEYPESNIVVAMLTGRSNQTDIIHALQLGADDYIVKPFQMSELVSRVERLVQKICRK